MRRFAAVVALVAAGLLVPVGSAAARAPSSRNPATEVCEDMVRNAVQESVGAPLPGPQEGAWSGHTYRCRYPLGGGQLVLSVDDLRTKGRARAAYRRRVAATRTRTRLNGLGDAAYQAPDGTLVAWKDQFVLVVDPSAVPPPTSRADVAFAAVVAVLDCWTGART
jgi:hypothetical protein